MSAPSARPAEPEEILNDLLGLDPGLKRESYYGERSIFFNPGVVAPLGTIFASIKDRDGPNDRASNLSRPGVFRFAFCLSRQAFEQRFGETPRRPPKGGVVDLARHDVTRLRALTPHPVYAWMRWVQILSPTRDDMAALQPFLEDSLEAVKAKWREKGRG